MKDVMQLVYTDIEYKPKPAPLAKGPLAKGKPSATELLYELSAAAQRLAKRY